MTRSIGCVFIVFIMSLMLISCGGDHYPSVLVTADSLMTRHEEDSAAVLLRSFAKDTAEADESVKMYYTLLELELQDKRFIPLRDLVKSQTLVHYYRCHGSEDKLAKALFYVGCTYRDLNDSPSALDYFQQSEEKAEKLKDYWLLEAVNREKGELLMYQGLYKESAEAYRRYYKYTVLCNDTNALSSALYALAKVYEEYNDPLKAITYYQRAIQVVGDNKDLEIQLKYELLGQLINASHLNEAKIQMAKMPVDNLLWGDYYLKMGRRDSAQYYYRRALNHSYSLYENEDITYNLYELCEKQHNITSAFVFLKQYVSYHDSIDAITKIKQIKQVQSLYNYNIINGEKSKLQREKDNYWIVIMMIVCSFFVVLLVGIGSYFYYKKKRDCQFVREHLLRLEEEQKAQYSFKRLKENQSQLQLLKMKLEEARQKEDKAKIEKLTLETHSLKVATMAIEVRQQKQKQLEKRLFSSSIYIQFMKNVESGKCHLSENEWNLLERSIDETYDNVMQRLSHLVKLNITERRICCLLKLQIAPSIIALFIDRTKSTVSLARLRLYKKITGKEGTAHELDEFISNF